MFEIAPITDDAAYDRAIVRIGQLVNNWSNDEELDELKTLSTAADRYAQTRFEDIQKPTDGPDEIEFMLDQERATLDELVEVFGGSERFVEYMTRRRNLDDATMDAIVSNFNTRREFIDKPFRKAPGWDEDVRRGDPAWVAEMAEMVRESGINTDRQDTGKMLDAAQVPCPPLSCASLLKARCVRVGLG